MKFDPVFEIEQEEHDDGAKRHYLIDGHRVPSVTTILKVLDKPALVPWAWNLAAEGAAEVVANRGVMPETFPHMKAALASREWGHWQKRDKAGLRGRQLHAALESLILKGEPPSLSDYDEADQPYVTALAKWWTNTRPKVVATETMVGSRRFGFGGRLDFISEEDDDYDVWDVKSGKREAWKNPVNGSLARFPYTEHHLQSAGYQIGFAERFGSALRGGMILNLADNGDYRVTPALASADQFLSVLNAYRQIDALTLAMSDWKKQCRKG